MNNENHFFEYIPTSKNKGRLRCNAFEHPFYKEDVTRDNIIEAAVSVIAHNIPSTYKERAEYGLEKLRRRLNEERKY